MPLTESAGPRKPDPEKLLGPEIGYRRPLTLVPVQIAPKSGYSAPSKEHAVVADVGVRPRDPLASTTRLPRDS